MSTRDVATSRPAIRFAHLLNLHLTATETALNAVGTHNRHISPKSMQNRLCESGIPVRCSYVSHLRRMAWLTVDAPGFLRSCFTRSRRRVYRHRGERSADACVDEQDRFRGGSVMV